LTHWCNNKKWTNPAAWEESSSILQGGSLFTAIDSITKTMAWWRWVATCNCGPSTQSHILHASYEAERIISNVHQFISFPFCTIKIQSIFLEKVDRCVGRRRARDESRTCLYLHDNVVTGGSKAQTMPPKGWIDSHHPKYCAGWLLRILALYLAAIIKRKIM